MSLFMQNLLCQINLIKVICFFILSLAFINVNGQIIIQDTLSGKKKEINFGDKIFYRLFSDSVLDIEMAPDYGIIETSYDSIIIFKNGTEISTNDISYLKIDFKGLKKLREFSKPFIIVGLAVLSKGVLMAIFEGRESNNKEIVPIYLSVGTTITGLSILPFMKKNKTYDLAKGDYKIITP